MLPAQVWESLDERSAYIARLAGDCLEWGRKGLEMVVTQEHKGAGVGVVLVPKKNHEFLDLFRAMGVAQRAAEGMGRRIELCALRPAIPDGLEISDNQVLALANVLRAHFARGDMLLLLPDLPDVEVLPAMLSIADRRDALGERPGAVDLSALPMKDAVTKILERRWQVQMAPEQAKYVRAKARFGEAVDKYLVAVRPSDDEVDADEEGDSDSIPGIYAAYVHCSVPIEERLFAVKDIFQAAHGIDELDNWKFEWLDSAFQPLVQDDEVGAHELPGGWHENAGYVDCLVYELSEADACKKAMTQRRETDWDWAMYLSKLKNDGLHYIDLGGDCAIKPMGEVHRTLHDNPGAVDLMRLERAVALRMLWQREASSPMPVPSA